MQNIRRHSLFARDNSVRRDRDDIYLPMLRNERLSVVNKLAQRHDEVKDTLAITQTRMQRLQSKQMEQKNERMLDKLI